MRRKESPTSALRVLLTPGANPGSVPVVLDLARALLRKGHHPVVYGIFGDVDADALRAATVPVLDDLSALNFAPDVIHGHDHLDTMIAALHFAGTPVVVSCRDWDARPPVFPTVARWIAIDAVCAERLATSAGVEAAHIRTVHDGVDIARFAPRAALPATPRRARVFGNHANDAAWAATIVRACRQAGIAVDIATNDALHENDLVFATGRRALEAMATGCATVIADRAGLAGLVTTTNFERLRALGFGVRSLQGAPVTEAGVLAAIAAFDSIDAGRVCELARVQANADTMADALLIEYRAAIDAARFPDPQACTQAAARYLHDIVAPLVRAIERAHDARRNAEGARDAQVESAQAAALAADKRIDAARQSRDAATTERDVALKAHDEMEARLARALQRALDAGIERDAAFAARDEAKDAQLVATLAQARMAEAQARSAEAHADGLRAQGQLALDLADANARLASLESELEAARRALNEVQNAKPIALLGRLRARFVA